ncbi:hypothetical protein LR48_Vigan01g087300 [Vigna angularis]|uniref:Uncharacterized protein n=1 Tax=Phaseolus angularis TaxID=3914 RepID=A0A0L9TL52_PHAAN|nr:hypothetical protein LR48_Vigan01g087300 [Vigna angularis]
MRLAPGRSKALRVLAINRPNLPHQHCHRSAAPQRQHSRELALSCTPAARQRQHSRELALSCTKHVPLSGSKSDQVALSCTETVPLSYSKSDQVALSCTPAAPQPQHFCSLFSFDTFSCLCGSLILWIG